MESLEVNPGSCGPRRGNLFQAVLSASVALLVAGCQTGGLEEPQISTDDPVYHFSSGTASVSGSVSGTTELGEITPDTTLSDYLTFAALNNPGLRAAFERWKAALERIPQVKALPDPKFTYGYFIREVETRAGPQEQRVGLAQTYPWFGKLRLRGEVAGEAAKAAEADFQAIKLKLFFEVKDAYYELWYLARALAIVKENIQLLKELEVVAEAKLAAGKALTGVLKAQTEIGKLEDQLRTLNDLRSPIVAKLNAALSRPAAAEIPWPRQFQTGPTAPGDAQLLTWMREGNPELKSLDFQIAKQEKSIRLAEKNFYPDLTFGLDYIQTDAAINPSTPDSGKDAVLASVSLNIPLWLAKYRAGVQEARRREAAAFGDRRDRENTLAADLKMALYQFRDAERKIGLYGDTLTPLAKKTLDVERANWEGGTGDFLDLIDAERVLLEFELQFERARASREQRIAEIEKLVGRSWPATSPPSGGSPTPPEHLKEPTPENPQ